MKFKLSNKKTQLFSFDYFVAISLFLLLLSLCLVTYTNNLRRLYEKVLFERMSNSAQGALDVLVHSSGIPFNWENEMSALTQLGLMEGEYKISPAKLDALKTLTYEEVKKYLGLQNYEFYLRLTNLNGNTQWEIGSKPEGEVGITLRRYVFLDNEVAILELTVWCQSFYGGEY